jgi:hypothetical protein
VRVALLLTVLGLACPCAATAADSFSVVFSGSGTAHLADEQRWILLDENECYLRKTVDQSAALSWTLGWTLRLGAKAGAPTAAPSMQGPLAGTEVADLCGEEETRPEDVPENWVHESDCTGSLTIAPGALTAATRNGTLILTALGPQYSLPEDSICSIRPRSSELQVRVVIPLRKLTRGRTITIPVGSGVAKWGLYTPHLNCMHAAKPYDGYRSEDQCGDDLSWSGTIAVTRSR